MEGISKGAFLGLKDMKDLPMQSIAEFGRIPEDLVEFLQHYLDDFLMKFLLDTL